MQLAPASSFHQIIPWHEPYASDRFQRKIKYSDGTVIISHHDSLARTIKDFTVGDIVIIAYKSDGNDHRSLKHPNADCTYDHGTIFAIVTEVNNERNSLNVVPFNKSKGKFIVDDDELFTTKPDSPAILGKLAEPSVEGEVKLDRRNIAFNKPTVSVTQETLESFASDKAVKMYEELKKQGGKVIKEHKEFGRVEHSIPYLRKKSDFVKGEDWLASLGTHGNALPTLTWPPGSAEYNNFYGVVRVLGNSQDFIASISCGWHRNGRSSYSQDVTPTYPALIGKIIS